MFLTVRDSGEQIVNILFLRALRMNTSERQTEKCNKPIHDAWIEWRKQNILLISKRFENNSILIVFQNPRIRGRNIQNNENLKLLNINGHATYWTAASANGRPMLDWINYVNCNVIN